MKNDRKHWIILAIFALFLSMLSCSESLQQPVQTAAAGVAQTAMAEGEKAAKTEAAKLWETAQVVARTEAAKLWETAQVAAPTEAAKLWATAQAGASTEAYSAFGTLVAKAQTEAYSPFGTLVGQLNPGEVPQFSRPLRAEGVTEARGSIIHTGPDRYAVDYVMASEGADVFPALPGLVVFSGFRNDYGNAIAIRTRTEANGIYYYSIYTHMQDGSLVAEGATVDVDDVIGRVGITGIGSQGVPHLHFAVRVSDQEQSGTTALYGYSNQTAFDFDPFMP